MSKERTLLHRLVDIDSVEAVHNEIRTLNELCFPGREMPLFERCLEDTLRLFRGEYKGYQPCKTKYHDLRHTLDVLLATSRLIHACLISGRSISSRGAERALIASLMHDTGYIQEEGEGGTGGQHTLTHVERSVIFMDRYGPVLGLSDSAINNCRCMITATSLTIPFDSIRFASEETELLAKVVGSADLMGQMADRLYLEKLLCLFKEFEEAGIFGIAHEFELLCQTKSFYTLVMRRLEGPLGALHQTSRLHFRERWQLDRDIYRESIEINMEYLEVLIHEHKEDYRSNLKRGGIVENLTV